MSNRSFTDLEVYKECRNLRKEISKLISEKFPKEEKFRLTDQIIRSSRSVTASIAEGHGRFHFQENIQYNRISRGSLFETLDHLIVALDEGYISQLVFDDFKMKIDKYGRLLNGYINYLKKSKKDQ